MPPAESGTKFVEFPAIILRQGFTVCSKGVLVQTVLIAAFLRITAISWFPTAIFVRTQS